MSRADGSRIRARDTEEARIRLEELEFLLSCGTPAGEAIRRLDFPTADAAETFLRRRGRRDLARRVSLEAGDGEPYTEMWERAFLVLNNHSRNTHRKKQTT